MTISEQLEEFDAIEGFKMSDRGKLIMVFGIE